MIKNVFLLSLLVLSFSACKKSSPTTSTGGGGTTPSTKQQYYGQLIVSESTIDSSTTTSTSLILAATFYKYPDSVETDAGTVTAGSLTLYQFFGANGPYLLFGSSAWPTSTINWSVTGSSTVTAFNHTCSKGLPTSPTLTSGVSINKAMDFKITCTSVIADSVFFSINDGYGNSVDKTLKSPVTSCTFSAAELSTLMSGNSSNSKIEVAGINYMTNTINGKNYKFANGRGYTKYKLSIF